MLIGGGDGGVPVFWQSQGDPLSLDHVLVNDRFEAPDGRVLNGSVEDFFGEYALVDTVDTTLFFPSLDIYNWETGELVVDMYGIGGIFDVHPYDNEGVADWVIGPN